MPISHAKSECGHGILLGYVGIQFEGSVASCEVLECRQGTIRGSIANWVNIYVCEVPWSNQLNIHPKTTTQTLHTKTTSPIISLH